LTYKLSATHNVEEINAEFFVGLIHCTGKSSKQFTKSGRRGRICEATVACYGLP